MQAGNGPGDEANDCAHTCTYALIVAQDWMLILAMISLENCELPFSKIILLSRLCVSPEMLNLSPNNNIEDNYHKQHQ